MGTRTQLTGAATEVQTRGGVVEETPVGVEPTDRCFAGKQNHTSKMLNIKRFLVIFDVSKVSKDNHKIPGISGYGGGFRGRLPRNEKRHRE
jgi:hypothetical protein